MYDRSGLLSTEKPCLRNLIERLRPLRRGNVAPHFARGVLRRSRNSESILS